MKGGSVWEQVIVKYNTISITDPVEGDNFIL